MRFIVDECTGPVVAQWLRSLGHDVFSVFDEARGSEDDWILQKAFDEERVLVTCDKDFGDLVYRDGLAHKGIILLRTVVQEPASLITLLSRVLANYSDQIKDSFVVVTESKVRVS
jgi:predicted nuclease of predicted toxin-antitoxin system